MLTLDQITGCLLGLALGDALGAPYEGGVAERLAWRVIGRTRSGHRRWTDDTQMSLDTAEALIANDDLVQDDLASRFAQSYRWNRGYGPGTARLLKALRRGVSWRDATRATYPDGSYGNGAAMRSPVMGLFFGFDSEVLIANARRAAEVTHAHALGIEGAVLIAVATAGLGAGRHQRDAVLDAIEQNCTQPDFICRFATARAWLDSEAEPSTTQVQEALGNGIAAAESCITAIYIAMRFIAASFLSMHSFVVSVGGDVDTIGAMAGALWGIANGATGLPAEYLDRLEQRERIEQTARSLYARIANHRNHGGRP